MRIVIHIYEDGDRSAYTRDSWTVTDDEELEIYHRESAELVKGAFETLEDDNGYAF